MIGVLSMMASYSCRITSCMVHSVYSLEVPQIHAMLPLHLYCTNVFWRKNLYCAANTFKKKSLSTLFQMVIQGAGAIQASCAIVYGLANVAASNLHMH